MNVTKPAVSSQKMFQRRVYFDIKQTSPEFSSQKLSSDGIFFVKIYNDFQP